MGPDGTEFITDAQYAQFDTDLSDRQFTFDGATGITDETLIDTSEWPTGTNTLQLRAQDASGRITPQAERGVVNVTVEDGAVAAPQYPTRGSDTTGTLSNFENMQADNGNSATLEGGGSGGDPFSVTTVTNNVPAGDYALEIDVTSVNFQGSDSTTVTVQDADGVVIGQGEITGTSVLSLDLDPSVEGDITVQYEAGKAKSSIQINYQRLT